MSFSTPLDLQCLLAWYNLGQGGTPYVETNCALFDYDAPHTSYLKLASASASWLDGLSKLTVAVDVLVTDAGRYDGWVTRWQTGGSAQFILRSNSAGQIEFLVANALSDSGGNYVHTTSGTITSGLPLRVVAVYDGTASGIDRAKIYINGELQTTRTLVGTIPTTLTSGATADLRVGADYNANNLHDGLMSRVCIWAGTALNQSEVLVDFNWWIGQDPAGCGEPGPPTHAWRLDESANTTRADCIGSADLTDVYPNIGAEAHVTQVNDLSPNSFHAKIRPINGPLYVSSGLNGNPTIKHVRANGQFLVSTVAFPGGAKPWRWSLYALAMCTSATAPGSGLAGSYGLLGTFAASGSDFTVWLNCLFSDGASASSPGANDGKIGTGCATDGVNYNQANTTNAVYSANTWFQVTGIFPGGVTSVNLWFNGSSQAMTQISGSGAGPCACYGVAHPLTIGASGAEYVGQYPYTDLFDGEWADIAICTADTTGALGQTDEESWQNTYGGL